MRARWRPNPPSEWPAHLPWRLTRRRGVVRMAPRRRPVAEPWDVHPSRGSTGEGESALTVVAVTGHLPTPRRWGTRVSRGGLSMTKDGSFKKVVRRHAEETGQRYTEALTDLEGLQARMHHEPVA